MPVADSFGCAEELRGATSGRAFPQLAFDSWAVVSGNAMASASQSKAQAKASAKERPGNGAGAGAGAASVDRAAAAVATLRAAKGLPAAVPAVHELGDRL
jgi:hypothetical protein